MRKGLGILILLVTIGGLTAWYLSQPPASPPGAAPPAAFALKPNSSVDTVIIRYGSEKKGFLEDPEVVEHLFSTYGIKVDGTKMGSLEMSVGDMAGIDGLWPSSDLSANVFQHRHPNLKVKRNNIFSTYMVFYSWPAIVKALQEKGMVELRDNTYYVVKMPEFLSAMTAKRTWKELGVAYQNGPVSFQATDLRMSNSGFLISGLMAILLNQGTMVDEQSIGSVLPKLVDIYRAMGYMEESSGILFDKYIKQGQGAFPFVANYESLLIEFYQSHPQSREQIKKMIVPLVPEPTVWSDHPFIALTAKGGKLLQALQDEKILKIAWDKYGFRSGAIGLGMDDTLIKQLGLPSQIQSATSLPAIEVMEKILAAVQPSKTN
jgi:hypothetical protein